jgi:hypothetical protein
MLSFRFGEKLNIGKWIFVWKMTEARGISEETRCVLLGVYQECTNFYLYRIGFYYCLMPSIFFLLPNC